MLAGYYHNNAYDVVIVSSEYPQVLVVDQEVWDAFHREWPELENWHGGEIEYSEDMDYGELIAIRDEREPAPRPLSGYEQVWAERCRFWNREEA